MITFNEIYAAVLHSWALFRGDHGALNAFDSSYDGFWRSFGVIFVLAPFYAIVFLAEQHLILADPGDAPVTFSGGAFLFWKFMSALVDWALLPILLALLAKPLNFANRFTLLIVARNWTSIFAILPYALGSLLFVTGLLSTAALLSLWIVLMFVLLWFRYQVFSAALGGPTSVVVGFVALDFVLSFLIAMLFSRVMGMPG